jgi:hypothetical protein
VIALRMPSASRYKGGKAGEGGAVQKNKGITEVQQPQPPHLKAPSLSMLALFLPLAATGADL